MILNATLMQQCVNKSEIYYNFLIILWCLSEINERACWAVIILIC